MKKSTPPTIREAVLREMKKRGLTMNGLAMQNQDIMSRDMFNKWLRGVNNIADDKASLLLKRLGIKLKPSQQKAPLP